MAVDRIPRRYGRPGATIRKRFKLSEALQPGASAKALIVYWDGTDYKATQVEITVWDTMQFEGDQDGIGMAEYWPDSQRWEVIQLQCPD